MPSLEELSNPQVANEFAHAVAKQALEFRSKSVEVNGGIRSPNELLEHLKKGRDVPFDYERLIDESNSYL